MQSWLSPPPSYNEVRQQESLWQPYYMEQYENELDAVGELQHRGTFEMKPPYPFGTHEDDLLPQEYRKLDLQVLVIASSLINGQRGVHHFLSQRH